MPNDEQKALQGVMEEMLTEWEIFINNQSQLVKDAKAILRRLKRDKK